jgi:hypothetical protein
MLKSTITHALDEFRTLAESLSSAYPFSGGSRYAEAANPTAHSTLAAAPTVHSTQEESSLQPGTMNISSLSNRYDCTSHVSLFHIEVLFMWTYRNGHRGPFNEPHGKQQPTQHPPPPFPPLLSACHNDKEARNGSNLQHCRQCHQEACRAP